MTFWQSRYNPQLKLSQQDLLDISKEITQAYAPDDSHMQSELVLMPVDPVTLHAYWNIKNNTISNLGAQLIMRVYSDPTLSEHPSSLKVSFDIKLSSFQGQQTVSVPIAATAYSAVIGEINTDNSFSALVTSEIIHVPRETPVTISDAVPVIDSESANIEADNTHIIWQEAMPEHSINNSEQPTQKIPMFDDLFVTEINNAPGIIHVQRENTAFELNNNSVRNQNTSTNNVTVPEIEPFILKNFNNQGYDLKVYVNSSDAEFANILAKQASGFYISPKKSNITKLNSSGLGLYL
jgi:hypothetical protein